MDDFEAEEALEDEYDVDVLGGEGFTPDEIAAAESRFTAQLVSQNLSRPLFPAGNSLRSNLLLLLVCAWSGCGTWPACQ